MSEICGAAHTDPTGLIKLGTRYYNPTLARFTQTDPAHQDANPYTYAASNPTNVTDPTGRSIFGDIFGGVLIAVGVVVGVAAFATGVGEIAAAAGAAEAIVGGADIAAGGAIGGPSIFGGYETISNG
ncbi:MAG: RHS repeat-associated core domain-containing protein [Jatrophihabitans sp.]